MFDVKLDIRPTADLLRSRGLQPGGSVQKVIDSETMRYMGDYMPRRQAGELEHKMVTATIVGSGEVKIDGPFAHYLHEGILYVDSVTGSAWSRKDDTKVPTGKELTYAGAPMRGKKFFDRMKTDHKEDILKAAQAAADRGGT